MRAPSGWAVLLVLALLAPALATPGHADVAPSPRTPPEEAPQVVISAPWPSLLDPYDVGFMGESRFAALLQEGGFAVSLSTAPVLETLAWLRPGDVLVLTPFFDARFTAAETDALERAVRDLGIGLLVFGDHDDAVENMEIMNPLLARFGLEFLPARVWDPGNLHDWTLTSFPDIGVSDVMLPLPGQLRIVPPARALAVSPPEAEPPGAVLVAETEAGRGRVVAFDDMEWFFNGEPTLGLATHHDADLVVPLFARLSGRAAPDAEQLVEPSGTLFTADRFEFDATVADGATVVATAQGARLAALPAEPGRARWLVEVDADGWISLTATRGAATDQDLVRVLRAPSAPLGRVRFLDDGATRPAHAGPSGLLGFAALLRDHGLLVDDGRSCKGLGPADGVLVAAPLRLLKEPCKPGRARLAVLAEPWHSVDCGSFICGVLRGLGGVDPPRPADMIAEELGGGVSHVDGVGVSSGMVMDPGENTGSVAWPRLDSLTGGTWTAYRAAHLFGGSQDLWQRAVGLPGSWVDAYGTNLDEAVPTYGDEDTRLPVLVLGNDTRLIAGDVDPYTNLHLGPEAEALAQWFAGSALHRDMPGGVPAGGEAVVRLGADFPGPAVLEERVPLSFAVAAAPGAEVVHEGRATLLRWRFGTGESVRATYTGLAGPAEGWSVLRGTLLWPGGSAVSEAALRREAPRFELEAHATAAAPRLGNVATALVVKNVGDDAALRAVLELRAPLQAAPESNATADGFGDARASLGVGADGWHLVWREGALDPAVRATRDATWQAPFLPGDYAFVARVAATGSAGAPVQAAASAVVGVRDGFQP